MAERRSKRMVVSLDGEIILDEICYAGVIENISREGICMLTLTAGITLGCVPGTKVELKIKSTDEEILKLHCTVRWEEKIPPESLSNKIGMEIIDLPSEYEDFLKKQNYIELYT